MNLHLFYSLGWLVLGLTSILLMLRGFIGLGWRALFGRGNEEFSQRTDAWHGQASIADKVKVAVLLGLALLGFVMGVVNLVQALSG